jgi:signal transduction histidine kinase
MSAHKEQKKVVIIAVMVGGIIFLHYFTFPDMIYRHAFYRMLFYLPLVLGCFWFGLKGTLYVSASILMLYFPYVFKQWQGFAFEDFHKLSEVALYIAVAFILGSLVDKGREKQKALLRAESLAAIGRALSEVAHDMKSPLMAIGGFTNQIYKKLKQDDPSRKKLDVVMQETARLESMIKNMLDFGRPMDIQPTKTSLNELVLETVEIAKPIAKKTGLELKPDLDFSLPDFNLDASRLKQVLLNLMIVKTSSFKAGVVLDVIDHGPGIAEEKQESVFYPFFSTKKEGTGLGLAIVKKIVEAHGGEVYFRSNGRRGVTFTVRVPFER